jgi:hypothetical protein
MPIRLGRAMTARSGAAALFCCQIFLTGCGLTHVHAQTQAADLVAELRDIPTPLPSMARPNDPVEERRRQIYRELRQSGEHASQALAQALRDSDVRLRRHAALALSVLASRWYEPSESPLNTRSALRTLIAALRDTDGSVRAWSAQAIGEIGPAGALAVPELIVLLSNVEEGSRNSACIALRGIGPRAKDAIPALENALLDPSPDVRGFARRALDSIKGTQ